MLRAVLFDLDGTLLRVDTDALVAEYIRLLAPRFAHLVDPGRFVRQLLDATAAMMADRDPGRTNAEVFAAAFFPAIGVPEDVMRPIFEDFYARDFGRLRALTQADPAARRAVGAVLDRGLLAVCATNPIFPMTATRQRIEWAGLADVPFALVTAYEDSHFCKPNPEYFREVAERIGCEPRECLVAGNDVEHDLAAAGLGMRTYLVTGHVVNRRGLPVASDHAGTLDDLAAFLASADLA